jgi:large subunit ribosomal protein L10
MPTLKKEAQIEEIKGKLDQCTIAVATGYQGMSASDMTNLRAQLRTQGIEYRVIKNTLTLRAANELGKEGMSTVLKGPTAMAFGYGDVVSVAKGINGYITTSRSPLVIHGAVMGSDILTANQVINLASLPPRDELIARLLGQMQAPITGLVTVLSAPLRGLVTVLQRAAEQATVLQPTEASAPTAEVTVAETETEVATEIETETEAVVEQDSDPTAEVETGTEAITEEDSAPTDEVETEAEAAETEAEESP